MFPPDSGGRLGILMLSTCFPRPAGDVGHAATWRGDTEFLVVADAGPRDAVRDAQGLRTGPVLAAFASAARDLQARGAGAITTSCGFLALLQQEMQAAVRVPVVTSSLLLLPELLAREERVGVLTISATHLGDDHLLAVGVPRERLRDVIVQGVAPESEFASAILGNRETMDLARAGRDVAAAAAQLRRRMPSLNTLVLECTNMPPYEAAIREATGFDVLGLADVPALKAYTA